MKPLDPNPLKSKSNPPIGADAAAAPPAPAAPPPALSAPPGVAALWHAVARRWLTLLVLGLGLGAAGAAVAWFVVPAKYVGVATVHLSPPPRGLSDAENYAAWRANMALEAHGDAMLRATLDKPEAAELPEVRAQGADALAWLKNAAVVDDKTPDPEALHLTVAADRPEDAAALANLWAQACGEVYTAAEQGRIKERLKQLSGSYHDLAEQLRNKRKDLDARRALLGLEDPRLTEGRLKEEQSRKEALQIQRDRIGPEMSQLAVRREKLKAALAAPDKVEVAPSAVDEEIDKAIAMDPLVKAQADQLLALQKKLSERQAALRAEDRDTDSLVLTYKKGIEDAGRGLAVERARLAPDAEKRLRARAVDQLRTEAAKAEESQTALQEEEKALNAKVQEVEGRIAAVRAGGRGPGKSDAEAESLQAEVDELEAGVKRVGDEQAELQAGLAPEPRIRVMEAAAPPALPDLTKRLRAAGGAFLGLFGLVFLGVAAVEFRARRVYKSEDVSQGLGLPLMGTVPPLPPKARAATPAAEDEAMGPMIESMDAIRAMLLHAGRAESLRVLMVASAVSGEGKTSLASHLAASLARGGRRTLLVDGDLRNPAAHQVFGLAAGPGFSELLRGEVEPVQVVQNTAQENLSLLAAGAADRQALQCLAQEGVLRTVFDELKEQYDFLVVDVSPVLPVADALLIGEHADAVLLSVLRNVSRLPAVHAAQQRLTALGIRVLGAVVLGEGLEGYGDVRYPSVAAMRPAAQ
jgi:capsular exopolysaccharide synthesis family protein